MVHGTFYGTWYLLWNMVPFMVHGTFYGTWYLLWYMVPFMVHGTFGGTYYLLWYMVPFMVHVTFYGTSTASPSYRPRSFVLIFQDTAPANNTRHRYTQTTHGTFWMPATDSARLLARNTRPRIKSDLEYPLITLPCTKRETRSHRAGEAPTGAPSRHTFSITPAAHLASPIFRAPLRLRLRLRRSTLTLKRRDRLLPLLPLSVFFTAFLTRLGKPRPDESSPTNSSIWGAVGGRYQHMYVCVCVCVVCIY